MMSSDFLLDVVKAKALVENINSRFWSYYYAEDASALVRMLD